MQGRAPRPKDAWAHLEPYAQLFTALVPRAAGIELFDAAGNLRWSAADGPSADLTGLVPQSLARAQGQPLDPGELLTLPGGVPCYIFWLRAEDGSLVALAAVPWREPDPQPRTFAMLHALVRPALECLRRELLSRGDIHRLNAALDAHHRDLEMLLASGNGAGDAADDLHALVADAVGHLQCRFAALLVPEKSLVLLHHPDGRGDPADRQALAQMHRQLVLLAQRNTSPVILNKLAAPPGKAAPPYRVLSTPVRHPGGRTIGVLALFRGATDEEFADRHAQLTELLTRRVASIIDSTYDALTGLLNRQAFEARVRGALAGASRSATWSALYVDVDQLHVINDNCGMHVGDRVIAQIGELLRSRLMPGACAARISGDRFAVLLPTGVDDAAAFAEALRQGVAVLPAASFGAAGDTRLAVSVSVGVAPVRADEEFSHFAVIAETACKAAKDRGRNRVETYRNTDLSIVRRYEDVNIVPNLRMAMEEGRLRLEAQLIMPLQPSPDACWHYEILLRMIDDRGNTVGPDRFLSAAVRYQFMPTIDRWVVRQAVDQLRPHAALLAQRPAVFTINLSGQSLNDAGFADFLVDTLQQSGVNPSVFCFELTESAAVGNLASAEALMRRLRGLGCGIALDDFGTGLSSLAYLRSLPVDMLKIDGSFVRDILKDPRAESMVQAIAQLARGMQLTTVAEYVETDEIRMRIAALGVDYGQGFAIARPAPLPELLGELPLILGAEEVTVEAPEEGLPTELPAGIELELDPDSRSATRLAAG